MLIGSANAQPIITIFEGGSRTGYCVRNTGSNIINVAALITAYTFALPLPTNRGSKKLHIDSIDFRIDDADANNYVDYIHIYGHDAVGGRTLEWSNTTNRTAAANISESVTLTSGDMGAYKYVSVFLYNQLNAAGALDITNPVLNCYYD